ncbi:hypothetical protein V5799_023050, partial [Amblyomma americanum]
MMCSALTIADGPVHLYYDQSDAEWRPYSSYNTLDSRIKRVKYNHPSSRYFLGMWGAAYVRLMSGLWDPKILRAALHRTLRGNFSQRLNMSDFSGFAIINTIIQDTRVRGRAEPFSTCHLSVALRASTSCSISRVILSAETGLPSTLRRENAFDTYPVEEHNMVYYYDNITHTHYWRYPGPTRRLLKFFAYDDAVTLKYKVRQLKCNTTNPLFLNAGDFYQGTLWYSILKYNIVSAVMANMSYDSVCLGNHEFDDGPEGLAPFLLKMKEANVTVLGTNLNTSMEPLFENITLPKHIVYNISGTQVALLGVVTTETNTIARP